MAKTNFTEFDKQNTDLVAKMKAFTDRAKDAKRAARKKRRGGKAARSRRRQRRVDQEHAEWQQKTQPKSPEEAYARAVTWNAMQDEVSQELPASLMKRQADDAPMSPERAQMQALRMKEMLRNVLAKRKHIGVGNTTDSDARGESIPMRWLGESFTGLVPKSQSGGVLMTADLSEEERALVEQIMPDYQANHRALRLEKGLPVEGGKNADDQRRQDEKAASYEQSNPAAKRKREFHEKQGDK